MPNSEKCSAATRSTNQYESKAGGNEHEGPGVMEGIAPSCVAAQSSRMRTRPPQHCVLRNNGPMSPCMLQGCCVVSQHTRWAGELCVPNKPEVGACKEIVDVSDWFGYDSKSRRQIQGSIQENVTPQSPRPTTSYQFPNSRRRRGDTFL